MKKLILLALAAIITLGANAQKASQGEQTVTIQTNGVCQKCADKFKENVPYFKGVKSYTYDMKTAKLTIKYDAKKTNPDQLRQEVSKLGYNADNVKADPAARAKLPACCRAEKGCGGCSGHGGGQGCGNHGAQKSCGGHSENGGHNCGNHGGEKSCAGHAENGGHNCGNHGGEKSCSGHAGNGKTQAPAKSEQSQSQMNKQTAEKNKEDIKADSRETRHSYQTRPVNNDSDAQPQNR